MLQLHCQYLLWLLLKSQLPLQIVRLRRYLWSHLHKLLIEYLLQHFQLLHLINDKCLQKLSSFHKSSFRTGHLTSYKFVSWFLLETSSDLSGLHHLDKTCVGVKSYLSSRKSCARKEALVYKGIFVFSKNVYSQSLLSTILLRIWFRKNRKKFAGKCFPGKLKISKLPNSGNVTYNLALTFCTFRTHYYRLSFPQAKLNLIYSIKNFVYELSHELPNDLRLGILENSRKDPHFSGDMSE